MPAEDVLAMRSYYSKIGVWPDEPFEIDPAGWLKNFTVPRDREIAAALLDSFLFINEAQTFKMFESAFASIASDKYVDSLSGASHEDKWIQFRKSVVVSFPTDDEATASSSGYMFVRLARQRLNLPESQLFDPAQLVEHLSRLTEPVPVVLVDDIAGSGDQFCQTWIRPVPIEHLGTTSLGDQIDRLGCPIFYAPAICTEPGLAAIEERAPTVIVKPAHFLSAAYGANSDETILVPDEMRNELRPFVLTHSSRAGVPQHLAFGWGGVGLALAFDHSVPDLTLPLFFSEKAGWRPLRKRR